jgi:hypothetical protein
MQAVRTALSGLGIHQEVSSNGVCAFSLKANTVSVSLLRSLAGVVDGTGRSGYIGVRDGFVTVSLVERKLKKFKRPLARPTAPQSSLVDTIKKTFLPSPKQKRSASSAGTEAVNRVVSIVEDRDSPKLTEEEHKHAVVGRRAAVALDSLLDSLAVSVSSYAVKKVEDKETFKLLVALHVNPDTAIGLNQLLSAFDDCVAGTLSLCDAVVARHNLNLKGTGGLYIAVEFAKQS